MNLILALSVGLMTTAAAATETNTLPSSRSVPTLVKATINIQSYSKLPDGTIEIVATDGSKGKLQCIAGGAIRSPGISVEFPKYKFVTHDLGQKSENEANPSLYMKANTMESCKQALDSLQSAIDRKAGNLIIGFHDHTGAFKLIFNNHPAAEGDGDEVVEGKN